MQSEELNQNDSVGRTCHSVPCLQFKQYGQHPRYANDTSNKTCACVIMESMGSNANNMGCLRMFRNWIKTEQCPDTGYSEGMVETAKQAPSVTHTTHGVEYFHVKIITKILLSVKKLFTNKHGVVTGLNVGENLQGVHTFLIYLFTIYFCFAGGKD